MLLETLAPICMAVALLFVYFLHYAFVLQYSRTYTRQKMFGRYCALFFLLTYLVLPAVTTRYFSSFYRCTSALILCTLYQTRLTLFPFFTCTRRQIYQYLRCFSLHECRSRPYYTRSVLCPFLLYHFSFPTYRNGLMIGDVSCPNLIHLTGFFFFFGYYNVLPDTPLFLRRDLSISCDSSRYRFGVRWAIGMIFVYPVGGLSLYFFLLLINRHEIMSDRTKSNPIVDTNQTSVVDQPWNLIDNSLASGDDHSMSVRFDVPGPPGILKRRNTLRKLLDLANKTRSTSLKASMKVGLISPTASQKNVGNFEKVDGYKSSPHASKKDSDDRKSPMSPQKPTNVQESREQDSVASLMTVKGIEQGPPKMSMKWEANPLVTAALNDLRSSFGSVAERDLERQAAHRLSINTVSAALESNKVVDVNDVTILSPMQQAPTRKSYPQSPTWNNVQAMKQSEMEDPLHMKAVRRKSSPAVQPAMEDPFNVKTRRNSNVLNLASRSPARTPPRSPRDVLSRNNRRESIQNNILPSEKSLGTHGTTSSAAVPFADKFLYAKRPSISLPMDR